MLSRSSGGTGNRNDSPWTHLGCVRMPIRRFLRGLDPGTVLRVVYAVIYLVAVPTAIIALAWYDAASRKNLAKQNRRATVLLAHADCERDRVLRVAALRGVKTKMEIERIEQFFRDFGGPVDHALQILGEASCNEFLRKEEK